MVGVRPGEIVGVQTTSRSNLAARRAKALACPGLAAWLQAGAKFILHGWGKLGGRGRRKSWQCAEQELTLADVEMAAALHRPAVAARAGDETAPPTLGAPAGCNAAVGVPGTDLES